MEYNWTRLQKLPLFIPTYTERPTVDRIVEGVVLCLWDYGYAEKLLMLVLFSDG